ncbi:helix-turn-helix transcriptional regulator [Nostoc sp. FACHB-892]|uniref:AraC family transcriptional regulator n=1 Tax=Nostoc sp. FACHB-892 TaxID=2692843 RepID=UPI001683B674|nr:AraC family transcriptional regulator [Nostoc sp. FACHB-892]MBD2727829.1 helix-turn-helix transcriptional regulator [Nostoc sp. FACHB-892]
MSKTDHESCTVEKAILKSFNRQSLLCNDNSGWSGIRFQFTHSISASALPEEIVFPENAIHIYTDMPSDYVVEARINGRLQKSSLVTGHSLIIPRGTVYWQSDTHKSKGITLGFDSGFLTRTLSESIDLGCLELHPQFPTFDPLIYQIGLALKAELEQNRHSSRLYAESAATFLITHLFHHYALRKQKEQITTNGLPKYKLQQVIDYIHANLDCNIGLTELADLAQMSLSHFSRLFKQSTGYSPHQFVIKCRVDCARELLLKSDLSIADITYKVGFANQGHLTNHFKRLLGVTPKVVREK